MKSFIEKIGRKSSNGKAASATPPFTVPHDPTLDAPSSILQLPAKHYQYSPLFFSSKNLRCQIRLVKILPGNYADPICCTISTKRLGSAKYEALSYTWGDPSDSRTISVNGHPQAISITANCEAALRRLRFPDRERTVWIDAICINQRDVVERSRQVRLMADVFRQASCTLCYVGEPEPSHQATMRMLRTVHDYNDWTGDSAVSMVGGPDSAAIQDMLRRPWFSRVWILQEVYVSRNAIVLCGSDTIPWTAVCIFRTNPFQSINCEL